MKLLASDMTHSNGKSARLTREELSAASNYNETENELLAADDVNEFIRKKIASFRDTLPPAADELASEFISILGADSESLKNLFEETLGSNNDDSYYEDLKVKDGVLALLGKSARKVSDRHPNEEIYQLLSSQVFPFLKLDQDMQLRVRAAWVFAEFRGHLMEHHPNEVLIAELDEATKSLALLREQFDKATRSDRKLNWVIIYMNQAMLAVPNTELSKFGSKLFDLLFEGLEAYGTFPEKALDTLSYVLTCNPCPWHWTNDSLGSVSATKAVQYLESYRANYFNDFSRH